MVLISSTSAPQSSHGSGVKMGAEKRQRWNGQGDRGVEVDSNHHDLRLRSANTPWTPRTHASISDRRSSKKARGLAGLVLSRSPRSWSTRGAIWGANRKSIVIFARFMHANQTQQRKFASFETSQKLEDLKFRNGVLFFFARENMNAAGWRHRRASGSAKRASVQQARERCWV